MKKDSKNTSARRTTAIYCCGSEAVDMKAKKLCESAPSTESKNL